MLKIYLSILLFIVFVKANAQTSLNYNEDDFTFEQLNDSLKNNITVESKLKLFSRLYLKKSKKQKDNVNLFEAYDKISNLTHSPSESHAYADSLLIVAKGLTKDYYIRALQTKATAYYFEKDYINSLNYELKALNETDKEKEPYIYYKGIYGVGLSYFHIQEYDKSYQYFKKARIFFEKNVYYSYTQGYFTSIYREAFALYYLNKHTESKALINIGLSKINQLKPYDLYYKKPYFHYVQALNLYQEKNYNESIELLKKNVSIIAENDDFANEATAYFYLGLNYLHLNQKENAMVYFKKTNDIFNKHNYSNPEIKDAYTYLISYYREQKNTEEELYYTNQLLKVMKLLQADYKSLVGTLHSNFDIKTLIADKKHLENNLNKQNTLTNTLIFVGITIVITLLLITRHNYRKRKEFLKNYNDLLKQREPLPIQESTDESYPIVSNSLNPLAINIDEWGKYILPITNDAKDTPIVDDKILKELTAHLDAFEKNHLFLNKDLNLNDLANEWNTNRTYLSQFINSYKEKSFIDYLNSLRIAYFLDKVDTDKKWTKYKIQAIAELLGFSSARSFSSAFMKSTGMSPSFYLQQVNLDHKKEEISA
ncbi:MAG: helix-turn-helix domain-containing protein [Myroides sp.]